MRSCSRSCRSSAAFAVRFNVPLMGRDSTSRCGSIFRKRSGEEHATETSGNRRNAELGAGLDPAAAMCIQRAFGAFAVSRLVRQISWLRRRGWFRHWPTLSRYARESGRHGIRCRRRRNRREGGNPDSKRCSISLNQVSACRASLRSPAYTRYTEFSLWSNAIIRSANIRQASACGDRCTSRPPHSAFNSYPK